MKRIYYFLSVFILFIFSAAPPAVPAQKAAPQPTPAIAPSLTLPMREGSVKFMAVGDTGRGNRVQNELAQVMFQYHKLFPFEFVLLMGDNIYYQESAEDMKTKFENVYRPLLDGGVKFYASLGNHDESNQRFYAPFNMNGEEYYRIEKGGVAFYALNSTYMDKRQLTWFENELAKDAAKWKIAFFHHPPYSSGKRHGSEDDIRVALEPLFLKYGVDVVFTGHEHFYERVKPQKGIYYFITGAGGEVRKNGVKKNSPLTEKAFDTDLSFMLLEIAGDEMHFQVISRTGATVDSGVVKLSESNVQTKAAAN
ncbi:MAG TPA: metallophosphoesterase [Pyrinomonadaceae bacterium]|jgi:predicted MPP superfamily phosphohydrolase